MRLVPSGARALSSGPPTAQRVRGEGKGRPRQGQDALTWGRGSSLERLLALLVLLLHHLSEKQPQRSENKSVSEPGLQSGFPVSPGLSSEPASSHPGLRLPGLKSPLTQAEL